MKLQGASNVHASDFPYLIVANEKGFSDHFMEDFAVCS